MITDFNKPLWPLLEPDVQAAVIAAGTERHFAPKQIIHSKGNEEEGLSIIVAGRVRFGIYTEDGNYIQTGLLAQGHCFGEATLFARIAKAYDADAFGSTTILSITKPRFDRLIAEHSILATALLTTLTSRLYEALEFADDLRRLGLEARIAKYLLQAAASGGFEDGVLPVRQIDVTYALGISRVSVWKALSALEDAGHISMGYGKISIVNSDALADLCTSST